MCLRLFGKAKFHFFFFSCNYIGFCSPFSSICSFCSFFRCNSLAFAVEFSHFVYFISKESNSLKLEYCVHCGLYAVRNSCSCSSKLFRGACSSICNNRILLVEFKFRHAFSIRFYLQEVLCALSHVTCSI